MFEKQIDVYRTRAIYSIGPPIKRLLSCIQKRATFQFMIPNRLSPKSVDSTSKTIENQVHKWSFSSSAMEILLMLQDFGSCSRVS